MGVQRQSVDIQMDMVCGDCPVRLAPGWSIQASPKKTPLRAMALSKWWGALAACQNVAPTDSTRRDPYDEHCATDSSNSPGACAPAHVFKFAPGEFVNLHFVSALYIQ